MTEPHPTPQPDPTPAVARQVADALALVRGLLAAGALDPAALGVPGATPAAGRLVPGQRITLRDLAEKTKRGCAPKTLRTYRTYLDLLVDGWPATAPEEDKLYPGLGDRWADEVLYTDLEEALAVVHRRALLGGFWREQRRQAVHRVPHHSAGDGAHDNAVGAFRRLFALAV